MVHWNTASCDRCTPSSGSSLAGPNSFRYPRTPSAISLGFRIFPVLVAGQCSEQRPHSTQVKACSEISSVMSLPVSRPKSSSPDERRNLAESIALQEDRHRAQQQVQMLGVRDQRQEDENGERVRPPQQAAGFPARHERRQIGDHQQENQQRDDARFRRQRLPAIWDGSRIGERPGRRWQRPLRWRRPRRRSK